MSVFFSTSRHSLCALLSSIGQHPVLPRPALPFCLNPMSHGCSYQTDPACISAGKTSLLSTQAVTCADSFTNKLIFIFIFIFIATCPLTVATPDNSMCMQLCAISHPSSIPPFYTHSILLVSTGLFSSQQHPCSQIPSHSRVIPPRSCHSHLCLEIFHALLLGHVVRIMAAFSHAADRDIETVNE